MCFLRRRGTEKSTDSRDSELARRFIRYNAKQNSEANQCARKQPRCTAYTNDGLGAEFKSPSIIRDHTSRVPPMRRSSFVVYPDVPSFPRTYATLTRGMAYMNGRRRKMVRLLLMCFTYLLHISSASDLSCTYSEHRSCHVVRYSGNLNIRDTCRRSRIKSLRIRALKVCDATDTKWMKTSCCDGTVLGKSFPVLLRRSAFAPDARLAHLSIIPPGAMKS